MRECVNEKKLASTHIRIDVFTFSLRSLRETIKGNLLKINSFGGFDENQNKQ